MKNKIIVWMKHYWIYIAGCLLGMNVIYVCFSDNYYYYNEENVRYTVAKYRSVGYLTGKSSNSYYSFSYEVDGRKYNTNTNADLSRYDLKNDRFLIKYSIKRYGAGEVVKHIVPRWVISPPKDGWKQFPPDINWKGAELDTAYLKKMDFDD